MNAVELTQNALAAPAVEVSVWALFWQASFIVKAVMLGLLAASIWCWAIIVDKIVAYNRARRSMDRFEKVFWSGQSLEELYRSLTSRSNEGLAAIFVAAMREWKRSFEGAGRCIASLPQRIVKVMDV